MPKSKVTMTKRQTSGQKSSLGRFESDIHAAIWGDKKRDEDNEKRQDTKKDDK